MSPFRKKALKGFLDAWSTQGPSVILCMKQRRRKATSHLSCLTTWTHMDPCPTVWSRLRWITTTSKSISRAWSPIYKLHFQSSRFTIKFKPVQKGKKGKRAKDCCRKSTTRGFMDDLMVTTPTNVQARWVLRELDHMASWTWMTFKPETWCLLIQRGIPTEGIRHLFKRGDSKALKKTQSSGLGNATWLVVLSQAK